LQQPLPQSQVLQVSQQSHGPEAQVQSEQSQHPQLPAAALPLRIFFAPTAAEAPSPPSFITLALGLQQVHLPPLQQASQHLHSPALHSHLPSEQHAAQQAQALPAAFSPPEPDLPVIEHPPKARAITATTISNRPFMETSFGASGAAFFGAGSDALRHGFSRQ